MSQVEMLIVVTHCDQVVDVIVSTIKPFDHCAVCDRKKMDHPLLEVSHIDSVVLVCTDGPRLKLLSHL